MGVFPADFIKKHILHENRLIIARINNQCIGFCAMSYKKIFDKNSAPKYTSAVFKNPSVIKSLKIIIASKIAQKNKTNLSYVDQESLHCVELSPLPSLLHIDDRNSMAFSIETRAPFLDYRLIEFTFSLPFCKYYKSI